MTGRLQALTGPGMLSDHEKRLRALERRLRASQSNLAQSLPAPPTAGGGGGMMCRSLAAYDASDESKARADLVCDGTDDDVEIKALMGPGIKLVLSEGTFVFDILDLTSTNFENMWIGGCGRGPGPTSTRLFHTGASSDFFVYAPWSGFRLSDLELYAGNADGGGRGVYCLGADAIFENLLFRSAGAGSFANLEMRGSRSQARGCQFLDGQGGAAGVYLQGTDQAVLHSYFDSLESECITSQGDGNADRAIVMGNIGRFDNLTSGVTRSVLVGLQSVVAGNHFKGGSGSAATITSGAGSQVGLNVLV